MFRLKGISGLVTLGLIAGGPVLVAQTATTGSIQGQITDAKGSPLAGASVRLVSAQVTRTIITGSDGRFQVGLLNSGAWQVTVSKAGFTTQNQSISISINETKALSIKLSTEAVATVEVVGSASSVDASSTTTGMNVNLETLSALPISRSVNDLAFLSPGVASAGSTFGGQAPGLGLSINGASGAENTFIVDGLNTNDFRYGGTATNLPTEFIESVDIQTGGFKPEFGALGGVFTVVTKTGSNDFKGSAWVNFEPYSMQAVNKKTDYFNQASFFAAPPIRASGGNFLGSSASNERTEIGATAGGSFIKDKFFYWVGANTTMSNSPSFQNFSGTTVGKKDEDSFNVAVKLNYYFTQDQQLTASLNSSQLTDDAPNDRPGLYGDAKAGFKHVVKGDNFSLNYDWTLQANLLLSIKGGIAKVDDKMDPTDPTLPQITDRHWYNGGGGGTGTTFQQQSAYVRGGFGRYNPHDTGETDQLKADLSWFLGTHNLKFGIATIESTYHRTADVTGIKGPIGAPGSTAGWWTIRADGNRIDTRIQTDDSTVKATFNSFYAQDTWDVMDGLKVFYGIRYETQEQKGAKGQTIFKFDKLSDYAQPRLGFTWDPNNDGRTKISGSFARYFEQVPQRLAARVYGNEKYDRYRWTTGTGGQVYTYSSTGLGTYTGTPSHTDFAGPYSNDAIADGTKLPRRTEYTAGFERTLENGITVGIHGKYRTFDNIIEDSTIRNLNGNPGAAVDPSGYERAILWNPGRSVTWRMESSPNNGDFQTYHSDNTLFDPAKNIYSAVDFTLEKKTQRSYISFSYTWSRLEGNYEGLITSSNGQADASITASWDEWPYVGYGLLPLDRTHVVKLLASHNWDLGPGLLNIGVNWTYQSGTPVSLFDDGSTTLGKAPGTDPSLDFGGYGNAIPANFQLGQYGRTPATNNVDLHIDYTWAITSKLKLSPSVDLYNMFNTRVATRVLQQATDDSGAVEPRYGQSTDWFRGRHLRFGVKLTF
jgi:outer membrane receptor protein involved in Fe transport